jgi:hypothetical protein
VVFGDGAVNDGDGVGRVRRNFTPSGEVLGGTSIDSCLGPGGRCVFSAVCALLQGAVWVTWRGRGRIETTPRSCGVLCFA